MHIYIWNFHIFFKTLNLICERLNKKVIQKYYHNNNDSIIYKKKSQKKY